MEMINQQQLNDKIEPPVAPKPTILENHFELNS